MYLPTPSPKCHESLSLPNIIFHEISFPSLLFSHNLAIAFVIQCQGFVISFALPLVLTLFHR